MKEDQNKNVEIDSNTYEFKARPLNKKIFEHPKKTVKIEKKQTTTFKDFNLSKGQNAISKKTLDEYIQNKENEGIFIPHKSVTFDKKMFDQDLFQQNQAMKVEKKQKKFTDA